MRSFFKIFFASLLSLIVFSLIVFFFLLAIVGGLTSKDKATVLPNSVLVLNLGQHYKEQLQEDPLSIISSNDEGNIPGLYDVIRILQKAKTDKNISGIYIIANQSPNGFAASEEIRNALLDFKQSGKFIIAHGDVISQKAYSVANAADKIYLSPQGSLEWFGFSVDYLFLKGTLEKLDIEPQIFYAGKFKSATEIFRTDKMTPENKLQTTVWLNDLYNNFLIKTGEARKIDTATLHQMASEGKIQTAKDAVDNKLIDGLKYDDEIKSEIKSKLGLGKYDRISFVSINKYMLAGKYIKSTGEKIALIYAEGDIIDGKDRQGTISSETYRSLIRKARLDNSIKAIVFRVNSGGGSSLASESIWRELALAQKEKPVVVSFGDVAASGGYYISCAADSIFAEPTTITGSIGVFGIIPNMQAFFKNKLGVTFDGVKTGPYADAGAIYRPMSDNEKNIVQGQVELTYSQFKQRVADGRKKDTSYVDSIAQGRVWTGLRAKDIGLIDRFGGIDEAVKSAAKMAKLVEYRVREYPEPQNIIDRILGRSSPLNYSNKMKEEMGEENYKVYLELRKVNEMSNTIQARLPFDFFIH
ncbi:MAG: signal peptide peptidase SppA [Bacteroidia bacterium]|nr:signal peptide peptidase SppA [Bacteroidia bacterium]